jgi:parallel beta-helix repeat protein/putative cofactor-binding repeat protein
MRNPAVLAAAVAFLLCSGLASALPTTVYVDDDYTAATPGWGTTHFGKIQDGIDGVAVGGTVQVYDGTYAADATTGKGASITKSLTLQGQSRDGTIIDGSIGGVGSSGSYWPKGVHVDAANDVTVKNITVQGFTGDMVNTGGYGILYRDYDHDTVGEGLVRYSGGHVENVLIQDSYSAMYALLEQNLTVKDSLIQNNYSDGMFIANDADYATITGNTVRNSGDQGIWVGTDWNVVGPSDHIVISGNTVDGARESGIMLHGSTDALISHNIVTNVAAAGGPDYGWGWTTGAVSLDVYE